MPKSDRPSKFSPREDRKMLKEVSNNPKMSSRDLQSVSGFEFLFSVFLVSVSSGCFTCTGSPSPLCTSTLTILSLRHQPTREPIQTCVFDPSIKSIFTCIFASALCIMTERSDQEMEAASGSISPLEEFIRSSISRMDTQERNMNESGRAIQALVAQVSELTQQLRHLRVPTAPPTPPAPPVPPESAPQSEPRLPVPESYDGEPNYCRAFLTRCSMHFSLQPKTFAKEESKVAFVLTLLTGRAALWGTAVWENQDPCCASFQTLSAEMKRVFDRAVAGREAARILADLKQGERSVSDYSIEFWTLAAECQWNEEAQWDMFLHGLADRVQREIYALDLPTKLNELIELALRVDSRLSRVERRMLPARVSAAAETLRASGGDAVSPVYDHEPMQVGRARLSREEKERRRSQGLCLYCGAAGHFAYNCPVKGQARQ
ncbi:hypothetical protein PO909_023843 [Leuciscus waleckii]